MKSFCHLHNDKNSGNNSPQNLLQTRPGTRGPTAVNLDVAKHCGAKHWTYSPRTMARLDVAAAACICLLAAAVARPSERDDSSSWQLVFEDHFDDFDLGVWQHGVTMSGGGNNEFEVYVNNRSNSYVRDSVLYLRPTLLSDTIGEAAVESGFEMDLFGEMTVPGLNTACTDNSNSGCVRTSSASDGPILNPIQSAHIQTANSLLVKFGRVESRMKLPRGQWLWPAFWLLPRFNNYGPWPASGEIDVMESMGNPVVLDQFGSTLHWGSDWSQDRWPLTHAMFQLREAVGPGSTLAGDFYVYGLEWNTTCIRTFIYGDRLPETTVLRVDINDTADGSFFSRGRFPPWAANPWANRPPAAPFDREFYLIFNVAVGGTNGYFPDGFDEKPWSNADPLAMNKFWQARQTWGPTWDGEHAALQVDWVRVFKRLH